MLTRVCTGSTGREGGQAVMPVPKLATVPPGVFHHIEGGRAAQADVMSTLTLNWPLPQSSTLEALAVEAGHEG